MIVVDASVWVSYLVEQDVHHTISRRWLADVLNRSEATVAPGLLLAEIAGAVAGRTADPRLAHKAVELVTATPGLRLVTGEPKLAILAARLAADLRLRGPDAFYIAVAHQLNIPLVTWDKEQLDRAARLITTSTPAL